MSLKADLNESRRLLDAGMKLVRLEDYSKKPIGMAWQKNFATSIADAATGYGLPLEVNNRCSIDPDNIDLARIGIKALGFDLDVWLKAGVQTLSTRPGSGGRSMFWSEPELTWVRFASKQSGTVLELRAGATNLQDCVPGLLYKTKSGLVCTQTYANGRGFDDAPGLPDDLYIWWAKCSTDLDFRRDQEAKFFAAIGDVPMLAVSVKGKLAFEAPGIRSAFNREHKVETYLDKHGYEWHRNLQRWSCPTATGAAGIRPIPNKDDLWVSDHASDELFGIFDAWTCFVVLEHAGNVEAAKKAYSATKAVQKVITEIPNDNSIVEDDGTVDGLVPESDVEAALLKTATESNIALAFVHRFNGQLLYSQEMGGWLHWSGNHWQKDRVKAAFNYCVNISRSIPTDNKSVHRASFAKGVETIASAEPAFARTSDEFNKHLHLLATPGGTVDLRTGVIRKSNPEDMITSICGVAPKEGVPKRWLEFLDYVTYGDQELIDFLQDWYGYSMTGFIGAEKLVYLDGKGGNGKGVMATAMELILGDYFHTTPANLLLFSNLQQHATSMAALRGKRMIMASELPVGARLDEQKLKQMTGGDKIRAHFMRQDEFEFKPEGKLTIAANHPPRIVRPDDAMHRRLMVFPMPRKIENPDPSFKNKVIPEEAPMIFGWLIEGAKRVLDRGEKFVIPEKVKNASAEYLGSQDAVGQFFADCCENAMGRKIKKISLFKAYQKWCNENGENFIMASKEFYKEVSDRGYRASTKDGYPVFCDISCVVSFDSDNQSPF